MLPASLCAKIMVFRRITRIIEVVLNERAVRIQGKNGKDISKISEFNGKFVEKNQYEILFATDTRFEIISVSEQEDKINIKLKEL